jgi:hypothetical protein
VEATLTRRFNLAVLAVATLALLVAAPASASIRVVAFTRTVEPNAYASLTVTVRPRARCTITVIYDTVVSKAAGLVPKRGGKITWRWKVGSTTHPGRWPVRVNCGTSGKLSLRLHVV